MGKKSKAKPKIRNVVTASRLKRSETLCKEDILYKLQEVLKKFDNNENYDFNNLLDCKLLHTGNKNQVFPSKEFVHTNVRNKDVNTYDKYTCYRCKHFSQIPRNLVQPFCERIPTIIAKCDIELSFVQAIIYLKSNIASVSQISNERLQGIFNKQYSIRDNISDYVSIASHIGDIHIKQSEYCTNKDPTIRNETINTNTGDILSKNSVNIFDLPHNAIFQEKISESYEDIDGTRRKKAKPSFVTAKHLNLNKSPIKPLMPKRYIAANKKKEKFLSGSYITPKINAKLFLGSSNSFGECNVLEDENEYPKLKENARCLLTVRKNDIERANKDPTMRNERNTNTRDMSKSSVNIFDLPYNNVAFQEKTSKSYKDIDDTRGKKTKPSFVTARHLNLNESPIEPLMPKRYIAANKKKEKFLSGSYITPKINAKSFLGSNNLFGESSVLEDENEYPKLEENARCLLQAVRKNDVERANEEITQDFLSREEYISDNYKSVSSTGNQYVESTIDLEHNFDGNCFTPKAISQYSLIELASDDNPSFAQTQINEYPKLEENARCLLQAVRKNDVERVNKEITQDFLSREEYISDNYKSVSSTGNQYVDSTTDLEHNFDGNCFTPKAISQYSIIETVASDDNSTSFAKTQINVSPNFNVYNENNNFKLNNENQFKAMSDIIAESTEYDSAYSTLNIDTFNRDIALITESTAGNKSDIISSNNRGCPYNLRLRNKNKTTRCQYIQAVPASPSLINKGTKNFYKSQAASKRQFSSKGDKSGRAKKERTNNNDTISVKWLSFNLESINLEDTILASVKVIILTICDERVAQEYAFQNHWKGTLKEEAVNAILNVSDIFQKEKKPNICVKDIVTTIIETLDKITGCMELNKISLSILRIQIILELCNLLPVCVRIIDHLMQKLKSFHCLLIDITYIRQNAFIMMNQLHLIFYALNIVLQKYRTIIPNDKKRRSEENELSHVKDFWKLRYINEQLEEAGLKLDAAEEHWINTLENFAATSAKYYFVQFAENSISLVHALTS